MYHEQLPLTLIISLNEATLAIVHVTSLTTDTMA